MTSMGGFRETAALLKTLGHPIRLKIVCGLLGEPATLSRISRDLVLPVSTLAQHLSVLRRCDLLAEERRGVEIYFRVSDRRVPSILHALCDPKGSTPGLPRWSWQQLGRQN